jgi:PTS system nitrogen regulatory IIA component
VNRLAEILSIGDVLIDIDVANKARLFEQAGLLFEQQHGVARAIVTDNLIARERLGSTGLGHGVAIPHGRINQLKDPLAAVLRLRHPIEFDAPDRLPVGLFMFLFVPKAANQRHLEILSEIAEMLSDRGMRDRLGAATDAPALHRAIAAWSAAPSTA